MSTISYNKLDKLLQNSSHTYLIDVRSPIEFATGHLPNSINFPVDEFSQFTFPKHHSYIFICNTGRRAKKAYKYLAKKCYFNIFHIADKLCNWTGKLEYDF